VTNLERRWVKSYQVRSKRLTLGRRNLEFVVPSIIRYELCVRTPVEVRKLQRLSSWSESDSRLYSDSRRRELQRALDQLSAYPEIRLDDTTESTLWVRSDRQAFERLYEVQVKEYPDGELYLESEPRIPDGLADVVDRLYLDGKLLLL
jgi:hypothetical protein